MGDLYKPVENDDGSPVHTIQNLIANYYFLAHIIELAFNPLIQEKLLLFTVSFIHS